MEIQPKQEFASLNPATLPAAIHNNALRHTVMCAARFGDTCFSMPFNTGAASASKL